MNESHPRDNPLFLPTLFALFTMFGILAGGMAANPYPQTQLVAYQVLFALITGITFTLMFSMMYIDSMIRPENEQGKTNP